MNKSVLIANPPFNVYRGDLNPGQVAYHIYLDFYFRSRILKGDNVECPRYSMNTYGKRAENKNDDPKEYAGKTLDNYFRFNNLRDSLNLMYEGIVVDADEESSRNVRETFEKLYEKKRIIKKNDDYYLNTSSFNKEHLDEIDYYPENLKKEFIKSAEINVNDEFKITKDTKFSLESGLGNNFSPLFVLANMWNYKNDGNSELIFPMSHILMTKYALFRIVSQSLAFDNSGVTSIYRFPKINYDVEFAKEFPYLLKNKAETDVVRFAFALTHRLKPEIKFDNRMMQRSNKLKIKIENISKTFFNLKTDGSLFESKNVDDFDFGIHALKFESEIMNVSRKISSSRENGKWKDEGDKILSEYVSLLNFGKIFMPYLCEHQLSLLGEKNEIKG